MDDTTDSMPRGDTKHDDRRTAVDPADDPRPVNPPVDEEARDKGEDVLERVKPY